MTEQLHTAAMSGRDLSRARRKAMSATGANTALAGAGQSSSVQPAAATPVDTAGQPLTGKALSMARRAMLSQGGKSSLTAGSLTAGSSAYSSAAYSAVATSVAPIAAASVLESKASDSEEACCDSCAEDENYAEPCQPCTGDTTASASANAEKLDGLCDLMESSPAGSVNTSSSVRAYCRARRNTLSKKGKIGLPGKAGRAARKKLSRNSGSNASALTGKALARMHREDRCSVGRGDSPACRPTGRVRPGSTEAPDKVEVGTTLSGQSVTGTQVEQTEKVTGAESGVCHSITGTEYLGAEQFGQFCGAVPQAKEPKVGVSETSHGQMMTGSTIAANNSVTGSEAGSCKSVTGSEYLGVDHFQSRCATTAPARSQVKVIEGRTDKNQRVTGADEARDNAVTGSETGSGQNVTGSDYVNMQTRTINASVPAKVGVSHTASGMAVSGGESSRAEGITGDEQDACGVVTGTEYVSSERFQSTCGAGPTLTPPAKVGVDASRGGMTITGNLVDRDEKVTGNEPGTCQRVTGSQYDSSATRGFCDQRSNKVSEMHTLHGRTLTGTEVTHSPKLTGDDRGNCSVVTGAEYVSRESFQQSCSQQPVMSADKTAVSRTWNHQMVSGAQPGHSAKTTGDDIGMCNVITGSSYGARELTNEYCSAATVAQAEQRLPNYPSSQAVSGMTPKMDERLAGNFPRGGQQSVSGTPYLAQQAPAENAYQADFSVLSPAKAAWQQRDRQPVHNSVLGLANSAITGSASKAQGVISGTPEFRHPGYQMTAETTAAPVAVAPASTEVVRERVTGEGSEAGTKITGDDWSRGGLITGTEGLFSSSRNQTQRGGEAAVHNKVGAFALRDRAPVEVVASKITGSSGGSNKKASALVTLSGGACG